MGGGRVEQFILEGNLADKHLPRDPTLRSIGCIPMKPEASPGKSAIMCAPKLYIRACRVRHCVRVCVVVYQSFPRWCAHHSGLRMHTCHEYIRCRMGEGGIGRMDVCVWAITSSKLLGTLPALGAI